MKIIISHDVDHLYWSDHLTDLFYPKLWVRETLAFLQRKISTREWMLRMAIPFHRNLNHLDELMRFDKEHGIPSTFFFGMAKGLGMSYSRKKALVAIRMVQAEGFETGVHGIAYDDENAIQAEYDAFRALTGIAPAGIRMHYVRFTERTFEMLNRAGYLFDSTEFDKKAGGSLKSPYKIGRMWELPLLVMDTYLPYDLDEAKEFTRRSLRHAIEQNIDYVTILHHDTNFSAEYSVYREWYKWFVMECKSREYVFIDYEHVLAELD